MFQKKQIIYSDTLGVCRVDHIVQLAASREEKPVEYYGLTPLFGPQQAAYIPVENHRQMLRELFTKEEAEAMKDSEEAQNNPNLKKAIEYILAGENR